MRNVYHFPDVDTMPDYPALPVPALHMLRERFLQAVVSPENGVLRRDRDGRPIFGAYIGSDSNECITWGVLALGEWLSGHDAAWLLPTYSTFFSEHWKTFLNNPCSARTELWYLNYTLILCGAVQRVFFPGDTEAARRMAASFDTLCRMARVLQYDFHHQGFRYDTMEPWTNRDVYRQPDASGGYAYNMLFAAQHCRRPEYLPESLYGLSVYLEEQENPWYEIPDVSSALYTAAWHDAHGNPMDVRRAAEWLFDHATGPLQTGTWNGEQIDGLMMGWRGDTREKAMASAYSMESLMHLQFILPAVRWCPALADAVGRYARCLLSNFQLFYARGSRPLHETRPELDSAIPYERLVRELDGHSPAACGDFHGHRSVYGAGYLMWLPSLARSTDDPDIYALDLSVTDWLADEKVPVFLLRNPSDTPRRVRFAPADVWRRLRPDLYPGGELRADVLVWELKEALHAEGTITCEVPAMDCVMIALVPPGNTAEERNGIMVVCGAELWRRPEPVL